MEKSMEEIERLNRKIQINNEKYEVANKWIYLQNRGISVFGGLEEIGIKSLIIYGSSELSRRLLETYKNEKRKNLNIEIKAISDKKISENGDLYEGIPLVTIDDIKSMVTQDTCVIVTAMGFCDVIKAELSAKEIINVISLRDLIESAFSVQKII